jgi:hypothetical protein
MPWKFIITWAVCFTVFSTLSGVFYSTFLSFPENYWFFVYSFATASAALVSLGALFGTLLSHQGESCIVKKTQ